MTIRNQAQVQQFEDFEAVCAAAVETFVASANAAIGEKGRFVVALSGGSSPKRIYEMLAEPQNAGRIDWSKVDFFWGDERSVPPDHDDSNYLMAYRAMLGPLGISDERIHRMPADATDLPAAAKAYEQEIAGVFGASLSDSKPPVFDLIMLGMGPDAHTASLFPQTTALEVKNRWVVENFVPKFDTYRMTMTADLINQAKTVMFTLAGADKAQPLADVLEGEENITELPSQMINPEQGTLLWLIDKVAGQNLRCPSS